MQKRKEPINKAEASMTERGSDVKIKRKPIPKKVRFEVFKRDNFTCQYCGQVAPDVILQVDHIKPVKNGGENEIINYVTSCRECNIGKGAKELSDNQLLSKQRKQLEELGERREQLKLMVEWKEGLEDIENEQIEHLCVLFDKLTDKRITDTGKIKLKKYIKKFGFTLIYDCMKISCDQYFDETQESLEKAFSYIPRIASCSLKNTDKPYLKDLYYIRGILRNRFAYCNEYKSLAALQEAYLKAGATIDDIKDVALTASNWTQFRELMLDNFGVEV